MTESLPGALDTNTGQIESSSALRGKSTRRRNDLLACGILLVVSIAILFPAFSRGFPNGDDAYVYYRWADEVDQSLREGVLYPRWLSTANNGQGSPAMLYCPPLPILVVAGFKLMVHDTSEALALGALAGLLISGLAMYAFCRSLLSPWASLIAALFYIAAPYHVFDLYQRAALSEFWSFAWLPLALLAIHRIIRGGGWMAVVYLAISYALLLFTHVIMSFAFTFILPIALLIVIRNFKHLLQTAAGLALGVGVSAISFVSALFERDFVRSGRALRIKYFRNFLFEDLNSAFNVVLFLREEKREHFLEWVNYIAIALVLMIAITVLLILMTRARGLLKNRTILATIAITLVSLLMASRLTERIWQAIPQLPFVQFPFRWLVIATVGACVLAGVSASAVRDHTWLRFAIIAALAWVIYFNVTIDRKAIKRASYDRQAMEEGLSVVEVPEYRPVWWDNEMHEDAALPPLSVVSGSADVEVIDGEGVRQSFRINARVDSTLKLRQLFFPGWVVRIDGKPAPIDPADTGNIHVAIQQGEHSLELRFEDTRVRAAGKITSAVSGLALLAIAYSASDRRRRKRVLNPAGEPRTGS